MEKQERQEVKEISFKIKGKIDTSFKIEGGRDSFKEITLKREGGKENGVIRIQVIYEKIPQTQNSMISLA